MTNSTYAENNGDGFLYSILSHEDRGFMVLMACNMYALRTYFYICIYIIIIIIIIRKFAQI